MNRFKTICMLTIAAGASILTSCQRDMFDGRRDVPKQEYEENWLKKFGDIDPEQDWNSVTRVTVNLSIIEDALAEYKLQVLTGDPLHQAEARLAGTATVKTDAQGKASASIEVDYQKGVNTVYVARVDAKGHYLVKTAKIVNGEATAEFGVAESGASRSRASINQHDLPSMDCPYTNSQVNNLIAQGYDVKNGLEGPNAWGGTQKYNSIYDIEHLALNSNHILVISNNFSENFSFNLEAIEDNPNCNGMDVYTGKYTTDWGTEAYAFNGGAYKPHAGEVKVIVANGGTLTINKSHYNNIGSIDLIVASGGTLNLSEDLGWSKQEIYRHARIIVMPGGTVNMEGFVNLDGPNTLIYNGGTINSAGTLNVNDGHFYNAGTVNANLITLENELDRYDNFGKTYVKTITGNGSQGTINNNCYLFSDTEITCLYLNEGANSSVECENITFCEATLRENSMIKTKHLNNHAGTQSNYGGGWYTLVNYCGTADGAAILAADELTYINVGPADGSTFRINGRVFFEYNTLGSTLDNPWYAEQAIAAGTQNCLGVARVGKANYNIPEGDCTGSGHPTGDNPGPGPDPDPTPDPDPDPVPQPQSWIIAAEDMGSTDDYDFNDVVIMVSHVAGETTATITPLAAGGTAASELWFGDESLGEIHGMFGKTGVTGSLPMLNTGRDTAVGTPKTINVPANFSVAYGNCNFRMVTSGKNSSVIIDSPVEGEAPQVIIVPETWKWPLERAQIESAYPKFKDWSQNAGANTDWYNTYDDSKVYKR